MTVNIITCFIMLTYSRTSMPVSININQITHFSDTYISLVNTDFRVKETHAEIMKKIKECK